VADPKLWSGEKYGDIGLVGPAEKDDGPVLSEKTLAREVVLCECACLYPAAMSR